MSEQMPAFPDKATVDRLIAMFPDNKTIIASAIAQYSQELAAAWEVRARLLHNRLLRCHDVCKEADGDKDWWAMRVKESSAHTIELCGPLPKKEVA